MRISCPLPGYEKRVPDTTATVTVDLGQSGHDPELVRAKCERCEKHHTFEVVG